MSLWRPYRALAEVWDASHPDPAADPDARQSHDLLLSWRIVWTLAWALERIVSRWEVSTAESWMRHIQLSLVATAVEAVAAVLAISMVWALTRRQDARAAAQLPTARIA